MHIRTLQRTILVAASAVVFMPAAFVFAAPRSFRELVLQLVNLIDSATLMLFGLAILYFFLSSLHNFYGVMQGDEQARKELQKVLFMGVIIIFVMVSLWGIIQILQQTLTSGIY